MQKAQVKIH